MRKIMKAAAFMMCAVMLVCSVSICSGEAAAEKVEKSPYLDAAFQMLEEGNIFTRRYNEITSSDVKPLFQLGLPYVFGGKKDSRLFANYPDFAKHKCLETTHFYRKDQVYLYGLDCSGYTNWIRRQVGKPEHDTLPNMILKYYKYADNQIYSHRPGKEMPPWNELKDHLQVGDLLVAKYAARHIMMYIGTLSQYGFTAQELPELADYLDYPLVIHCGPSPVYGERYQKFIDENKDKYWNCATTDGGVQVSILGVPLDNAPYHEHVQEHDFDYYMLDEGKCPMTIWNFERCTSFCWFRD